MFLKLSSGRASAQERLKNIKSMQSSLITSIYFLKMQ